MIDEKYTYNCEYFLDDQPGGTAFIWKHITYCKNTCLLKILPSNDSNFLKLDILV